MLDRVGFYKADIDALRAVGAEVITATRFRDVPRRADAYFVWWWTYALPIVLWARLTKRPVFVAGTMHWGATAADEGYAFRPWVQRAVMKASARLATRNLCISRGEMLGMAAGIGGSNFSYFPCSVEADLNVNPDDAGSRRVEDLLTAVGSDVVVLSMALSNTPNLERKCIYELIDAFELVCDSAPGAHLVLCGNRGDGHDTLFQRARSSRHAEFVHFLGQVTESEKACLFARADLLASPSRFEGFGLAIAEAAAVGIPVLTSPVGAVPEVLGDGAVYCNGEDVADIATALERLIVDPLLREQVASRGRAVAERFSQDAKTEQTRKYLREFANLWVVEDSSNIGRPPEAELGSSG